MESWPTAGARGAGTVLHPCAPRWTVRASPSDGDDGRRVRTRGGPGAGCSRRAHRTRPGDCAAVSMVGAAHDARHADGTPRGWHQEGPADTWLPAPDGRDGYRRT